MNTTNWKLFYANLNREKLVLQSFSQYEHSILVKFHDNVNPTNATQSCSELIKKGRPYTFYNMLLSMSE